MKTNCLYCKKENPKHGMKTCSRKCADEIKKINSREIRSCLFCEKEFEVRKKDKKKLCSDSCNRKWSKLPENIKSRTDASKEAVKEKYGVDNVFQLDSTKEKSKETKLEKYGDENYNNFEKQVKTIKEKYGEYAFKNRSKKSFETIKEKYGVSHPLQLKEFKEKQKKTNLKKYGVENVSQLEEFKEKRKETMIELYGVENISKNEEIKQKKKDTSMRNFGVEHHLKDGEMFQKHFKAQLKMFKYKETELHYQGSYEKLFLELMEDKGLLGEVLNGDTFEYVLENKTHSYHVDFKFKGKQIEIKSGWTYNKNGKDLELQNINDTKWQSVRDSGVEFCALIDKSEIKGFIKAL